ncbi:Zinc finger protein 120 [Cricetulus griseus]|uniref:Zinc finger protein 120 n=1 Tax=Cricetulus griseus TaxID=10029 RepID=G3IK07_CRIGR|nr:Zinc finger protein 120 [Cricetulus griseus]
MDVVTCDDVVITFTQEEFYKDAMLDTYRNLIDTGYGCWEDHNIEENFQTSRRHRSTSRRCKRYLVISTLSRFAECDTSLQKKTFKLLEDTEVQVEDVKDTW